MSILTEAAKPRAGQVSIASLEIPSTGQHIVYDQHRDAPKGFGVRLTANGTRAFILRYRAGGREGRMTIGRWGETAWTLAAARKKAGELRREIDNGTDPLMQRKIAAHETTVAKAMELFCKSAVDSLKSGKRIRATLQRYFAGPFKAHKLSAVRRADVIQIVEDLSKRHGRQAHHLLSYIKLLFRWAEDRELIESNPVATLKPSKISKALSPKSRARVLTDDELRSLWENAETSGMYRLTALALKMILLTGQRPGEVAGMRFDEIDAKEKTWTIPASRRGKTDSAHTVPLTDTALSVIESVKSEIRRLEKRRGKGEWRIVFEARPGMAISGGALDVACVRFAKELGIPLGKEARWRPHDLRRTCRTALAAMGISDVVAEQVVGHVRGGILGVYDRHTYLNEKRAALEAWERRLLRIVAGLPAENNVIVLTRRDAAHA